MANYTALQIASFYIDKGVSPLKLQKLLYYSQVWWYVKTNKFLFKDIVRAWIYGPVVPDVWSEFKYMKRTAIIPKFRLTPYDLRGIEDHLIDVWNKYGSLTGSDLVDLTHSEAPWLDARQGVLHNEPSTNSININKITTSEFVLNLDGTIPYPKDQDASSRGRYSNY